MIAISIQKPEKYHIPVRTCRGCGIKRPKSELVRLVYRQGTIEEDRQFRAAGRGVYCCDTISCRQRLEKNKKVLKLAFRLQS